MKGSRTGGGWVVGLVVLGALATTAGAVMVPMAQVVAGVVAPCEAPEGAAAGLAEWRAFGVASGLVPVEEDVGELRAILRGGDKDKRRAAVNKLVKLDTADAWEVVIEALDNENAPAADEAQLDLANMGHPKVFDSLWGRAGLKSKSRIVKLRVAELVGRREVGVEAKDLAKALGDKDAEVRRLLLWSIERLADEGRLLGDVDKELGKDLVKLMRRDGDGAVRGAALFAFGAVFGGEAAAEWVATVAEDKDPRARSGAARNVRWLGAAGLGVARALAADEERSVRAACVWGLERAVRDGEREALAVLIERLESEPVIQLQWLVVGRLQALSGLKHRVNASAWTHWYDGLPADWAPVGGDGRAELGDDRTKASFAGLQLLSERLAFLIDLSGSIWNEKNGQLPKDVVGEHLNKALDQLTADTLFNVMPYTNDPYPWEDELVKAKSKSIEAAKQYFAECRERGAGNVYDAILLALEDERTENLVILTDGAPSGGTRWNLNLLVPQLLEMNRYRSVVYDSLLVGANGSLVRHWETLARETGGRCIQIEL